MIKICKQCGNQFEITPDDLIFYDKISPVFNGKKYLIPAPTLCPQCRDQRRWAIINEINLFERQCDATAKKIISNYPADTPYKVYDQKYWYSDDYDGMIYGRDFDFNRPFFEQFYDLAKLVPRPALFNDYLKDENSAYTNSAGKNKNCYLIFDSDENRDCYYCYGVNGSRNSLDCYRAQNVELCYELTDSKNCFNCAFLSNSENCSDSLFLYNCIACQNCIMCCNLQHKEFYFENKPIAKEKFLEIKKHFNKFTNVVQAKKYFRDFILKFPRKFMRGVQNENVTGDYLVNCKNAFNCFDCMNVWDGKYCFQNFMKSRDCMDTSECGDSELLYETSNIAYNGYGNCFSAQSMEVKRIFYSYLCFFSSDLFGCIGLKRKKYCILNKQYSKEEYEELVPKIIEKMKQNGEWGEFFPVSISPFPYNITMAQEYFPLTKEEAVKRGFKWREDNDIRTGAINRAPTNIPDDIHAVPDSITKDVLSCENCGKNYKIIPQELDFYKERELPTPHLCFKCRYKEHFNSRNPRKLWKRNCAKCGAEMETTYSPDRPEIVYCEKCYLKTVY